MPLSDNPVSRELELQWQVLLHGNPAQIEKVACDPNDPDPEIAWDMKEFGGGVLILDPPAQWFVTREQTEFSSLSRHRKLHYLLRRQCERKSYPPVAVQ